MKILIIDDNLDITEMLEKYLSLKKFEVTVSNDGRNGLALINEKKFDIILLDLAMPEFTGFDVIDSLEKDGSLKNQNLYIFTASSSSHNMINQLTSKEGIKGCVKKPVQLSELMKIIQS